MRVGMVILEHTVTCHATACVLKVDAIGSLGRAMNVWVCIRTVNYVTNRAVIHVVTIDVTEQAAARLDAQTTITAHNASSNALITARPPQTAAAVTTKETVCTDVSTALQVSTVTQVSKCWYFRK